MRAQAALCVPFVLFSLACGGMFFDQSQYEGTRTQDVYGNPLPKTFSDINLPPPGVNVGLLSGDSSLTTYHRTDTVNDMFTLYGDHLRADGWVEDSSGGVYSYERRFSKGAHELQLDAAQSYQAYGYGYGGMPSPSQMTITHYSSVLVAPWDTLDLDLADARLRCSAQSLEISWDGFGGPPTGQILNDLLRAFVLKGWDVESVNPTDTYGSASVTRGSARVDMTLGSPTPGSITLWYSGY